MFSVIIQFLKIILSEYAKKLMYSGTILIKVKFSMLFFLVWLQKLGHIVQQIFRGTLSLSLSLEKGEGVRKNGFPLLFEERIHPV